MNLSNFDEPLNDYVGSLSLSDTQDKRITSALENILSIMLGAYPEASVYAQGSYSTDTLAKPLTESQNDGKAGEYDVDIAIEREGWGDAVDALEDVEKLIEADAVYGQMTIDKTKNTCVRIVYAPDSSMVGFHIDIVPTKIENGARKAPDRENEDWKPSDAKKMADWFNGLAEKQPQLRSIVLILKRLRDLNKLDSNLKSILILTLVATKYYESDSFMEDLLGVLDETNDLFSSETPPYIQNPANPGENLADTIDDYAEIRKFFEETTSKLKEALVQDNADELKEIFGPSFKYIAEGAKAAAIASATAIAPVRAYGVNDAPVNEQ